RRRHPRRKSSTSPRRSRTPPRSKSYAAPISRRAPMAWARETATAALTPSSTSAGSRPMREVEFLPDWYPKVRKRKRGVALQAWVTLILMCGLGLWMLLVQRNVHARDVELRGLRSDLDQSESELARLEDLLQLQRQLGQQDQIFL